MTTVNGIVSTVSVSRVRVILGGLLLAWLVLVLGAVRPVRAIASGPTADGGLGARLAARDPGARVGGNTIVAIGDGVRVVGVLRRSNFIAALGSHVTIVGGDSNDQLGALGDDATIRAGTGTDLIYGGTGAKLIGGSGRDLLVNAGADATVEMVGSGSVAIVFGRHDRVQCAKGSHHDVIYAGKSDAISASCRADGARVLPLRRLRGRLQLLAAPASALAKASAVQGNGSNEHPFTAPCDDPQHVDCTVSAFERRTFTKPWENEYVPAYACPADHGYLLRKDYENGGLTLPYGVEIGEDWGRPYPIGVSITGVLFRGNLTSGTLTGFPYSSATNSIAGGTHWYRVILHCTSDRCHGLTYFRDDFPPPGCPFAADRARAQAQIRKLSSSRVSRAAAGSGADPALAGAAPHLAALDPGARIDGNTVVVTGQGATVFGVPHRPNFIFALGSNETVFGGDGRDELYGLGDNVTIRAGSGDAYVWGGRGGTLIGGSGRDALFAAAPDATVKVEGAHSAVVVSGSHDAVTCSPGVHNDVIEAGASATVSDSCRADRDRVVPYLAEARPEPRVAPGLITGTGTEADPYVAPCDNPVVQVCTVSTLEARGLRAQAEDSIPAYRCPADHPWFQNRSYAPSTGPILILGPGVEVQEDHGPPYPIDFRIVRFSVANDGTGENVITGLKSKNQAINGDSFHSHWYKLILHCASNYCRGAVTVRTGHNTGNSPPSCGPAADTRMSRRVSPQGVN